MAEIGFFFREAVFEVVDELGVGEAFLEFRDFLLHRLELFDGGGVWLTGASKDPDGGDGQRGGEQDDTGEVDRKSELRIGNGCRDEQQQGDHRDDSGGDCFIEGVSEAVFHCDAW